MLRACHLLAAGGRRGLCSLTEGLPAVAAETPLRVAIVGSGPSGFYTAKYLLKALPRAAVTMLERLPTPFGLVRSGVAPDHPEVKSVEGQFAQLVADSGEDRLRFLGNVAVGEAEIRDLRRCFDAVVFATGADSDRLLGIPGEQGGMLAARSFVGWYNGHPDFAALQPDLSHPVAMVVGNGNVALDCARILLKAPAELEETDIAPHALAALRESRVREVHVVGRRGHVQAAFTMKELREAASLDAARVEVRAEQLEAGLTPASREEIGQHRVKKRLDKLLHDVAASPTGSLRKPPLAPGEADRAMHLRFLQSPLLVDAAEKRVVLQRMRLEGPANEQRAVATGETEEVEAGLVLRSVGYASSELPGLPFDAQRRVLPSRLGRVEGAPGVFCVGWAKRGPSGIIGTNLHDAKDTVASIAEDAAALYQPERPAFEVPAAAVHWDGYLRIDAEERRRAGAGPAPREKIVDVEEMLRIAQA